MADKSNVKVKKRAKAMFWVLFSAGIAVSLLLFCQFFFVDSFESQTFMQNTKINGIDVSGLTEKQAENLLAYNLLSTRDEVQLKLKYNDKQWDYSGNDFEIATNISDKVTEAIKIGKSGNVFEKKKILKRVKNEGLNLNISYIAVLGGIEQKLDSIIAEIERPYSPEQIVFSPDEEQVFKVIQPTSEVKVDKAALLKEIEKKLSSSKVAEVEIPVTEIKTEVDEAEILSKLGLRSSFSTNYKNSSNSRKSNVKRALKNFNGMVVLPGQEVSFNQTTGPRNEENGYKKANIIVSGAYVEGTGGGVCQASTTLYNALILSGVDILEVNHHSLPASYVPLSLDAMVSEGTSDLKFKNNQNFPIYIKTFGDENEVTVQIYGDKLTDGIELKTRAELVKILPHNGDKIIEDTAGEYSNYVVYKGEYYRVKMPRQGYESKAYLEVYQDGKLIEEKEIRHDFYAAQEGIIVEGTEEVSEGITLPNNNVKFIPPQKETEIQNTNIKAKLEKESPSAFNP